MYITPECPPDRQRRGQPEFFNRLVIHDRLRTLAQDAERTGLQVMAEHLRHLADTLFDPDLQ